MGGAHPEWVGGGETISGSGASGKTGKKKKKRLKARKRLHQRIISDYRIISESSHYAVREAEETSSGNRDH